MKIEKIAERLVLTTLSTSAWRATRIHKAETKATRERHNSDSPKVLVTICDHEALTDLAKLHAEAYHAHRGLTLPSVQDGLRMLPASRQLQHSDEMRLLADRHREIVAKFIKDYDKELAAAPVRLNGLFDASLWPKKAEVERRFGFATRYLACPVEGAWGEWLTESSEIAEDALRAQLAEALTRVRDRCKGDGKLYSTVFSNLAELVAMVPDLNLTAAKDIETAAKAAKAISSLDADALRDDEPRRTQIAKDAGRILTMLGSVK